MDAPRPHPIVAHLALRKISKRALAEAMGYSPVYISLVVMGRYPPPAEFRRRAAAALDLPEHELFRTTEDAGQPGLKQVAP
jgi:transcriptional regulator with XRE-family HTH domain